MSKQVNHTSRQCGLHKEYLGPHRSYMRVSRATEGLKERRTALRYSSRSRSAPLPVWSTQFWANYFSTMFISSSRKESLICLYLLGCCPVLAGETPDRA